MTETTRQRKGESHHVDVHVGHRVRLRRGILGMSQGSLAEKVGITFQQIQKYEKGTNRISASKLVDIALALKTPVIYFFDGLPDQDGDPCAATVSDAQMTYIASREGQRLIGAMSRLPVKLRTKIVALASSISVRNGHDAGPDDDDDE